MTPRITCRCGKSRPVRFDTDGRGRLVDLTPPCVCKPKQRRMWFKVDRERRRALICQLCDQPTTDRHGRPTTDKRIWYCLIHRTEARAKVQLRYKKKHGWAAQHRWYLRNREKAMHSARKYYRRHRARTLESKARWRKTHRDKVKAQKRRDALRGNAAARMRRHHERVKNGDYTPTPTPRNERGERLCLAPGCEAVVHGRAKLCEACRYQVAA